MKTTLAPRRRGLTWAQKDSVWGYAFVTPQLIGFTVFVLIPIVSVFLFSMESRNLLSGKVSFIGLDNYATMFGKDPLFWKTIGNTLVFSAGLVPFNIALALLLANLLARALAGITFFRAVFFAPVITASVAWAIVWQFLLQGERGPINQFLAVLGLNGPDWLRTEGWAMAAVIFSRVIKTVGLNTVIFLAALKNIPSELVEAAQIDGANRAQVFRKITLPLLAPTTMLVTVITVIGSLQVFDHIVLLTQGGPANSTFVLVYYIYFQAFKVFETGYASSLAVVLFVIALTLTLVQWALRRRFVYNEV